MVGRIARYQHGVVTRKQLLDAGVSKEEMRRRLNKGALLRVHPGVYRVGHRAPSIDARYMAAVLACGPGALLSGLSAAHLWGLLKGSAPPPEVTAPTQRRVRGVKTRRRRRGEAPGGTTWRGIPISTVPQTLVAISSSLSLDDLARACHEAGVKHGTTPRHVEAVLEETPKAAGAKKLRRVMHGDVHVALSALERAFLKRLKEANLPLPVTNYHNSRHAWELDRKREREARGRGDDFRRYTHDDVFGRPQEMLRELRGLLHCPG